MDSGSARPLFSNSLALVVKVGCLINVSFLSSRDFDKTYKKGCFASICSFHAFIQYNKFLRLAGKYR